MIAKSKILGFTISYLISLFILTPLYSQIPDSCKLRIGTNLSAPADYNSEWPWVDIMKGARTWTAQNDRWVDGGENPWDTGLLDSIPLDDAGYPLELPAIIPGAEAPQILSLVWAGTENLASGIYTLLYDGEGEIDFWGDAHPIEKTQGRITFNMTAGVDGIFLIKLLQSKRGNHIRNMRVLMPGTEDTYLQNPWSEAWLEKLEPFKAFRFMDWGQTNNSLLAKWEDRPKMNYYTYSETGVPYEWMIDICNRQHADAWVCIPHMADDNFIRQLARMFRDGMDPGLKVYIEYSNEIWNWGFEQTRWVDEHGDQSKPWPEKYVPLIQHALDVWSEEWEGQMERTVRVVGVFEAWQDVSNRVIFNMRPGSYDAVAPAAYFGFTDATYAEIEKLGAAATGEDVIRLARKGIHEEYAGYLRAQSEEIAQKLDIPLLYYEGGQHLTPNPFGTDQPYGPALVEAQRTKGMYDLYNEWMDTIRQVVPEGSTSLFMNFSLLGRVSAKYGSWGALEHQFNQNAPYNDAPKYRALLDNIYNCADIQTSLESIPVGMSIFPNPSNGTLRIQSEEVIKQLAIINLHGEVIQIYSGDTLDKSPIIEGLSNGFYILEMTLDNGDTIRKRVIVY